MWVLFSSSYVHEKITLFGVEIVIEQGSGKYRLTIKQNNGDSSTSPIIIPSIPYVYDGQSGDYSHTFSIPDCKATESDAPDVWFQYTSPAPQQLNITTCGSAVDTAVALLSSGSSPNVIKCNDDGTHQECSTASELIVVSLSFSLVPPLQYGKHLCSLWFHRADLRVCMYTVINIKYSC